MNAASSKGSAYGASGDPLPPVDVRSRGQPSQDLSWPIVLESAHHFRATAGGRDARGLLQGRIVRGQLQRRVAVFELSRQRVGALRAWAHRRRPRRGRPYQCIRRIPRRRRPLPPGRLHATHSKRPARREGRPWRHSEARRDTWPSRRLLPRSTADRIRPHRCHRAAQDSGRPAAENAPAGDLRKCSGRHEAPNPAAQWTWRRPYRIVTTSFIKIVLARF